MGGANSTMSSAPAEVRGHPLVQGYVHSLIGHTVEKQVESEGQKWKQQAESKDMGADDEDLLASYLHTTSHGMEQCADFKQQLTPSQQTHPLQQDKLNQSIQAVEQDLVLLLAMKHYTEFIASSVYQDWIDKKAESKLKICEEQTEMPGQDTGALRKGGELNKSTSMGMGMDMMQNIWSDDDGRAVFIEYLHTHHGVVMGHRGDGDDEMKKMEEQVCVCVCTIY
ncbi:hypothetical protein EON63_13980 [archaeon]|nr:MAG: hypothetical protein EON63_13980 [archaeon]